MTMDGDEIRMMRGKSSPAERADDYSWVESLVRNRGSSGSMTEPDENLNIIVESDLLRTVLFTFLLGGLLCLLAYFSIHVARGEGRSVFLLTATLAGFLACGAVASRQRKLQRFALAVGSLCVVALLLDQVAYSRWHRRVDHFMTTLQQDIDSGVPVFPNRAHVRPTSLRIDPDQEVHLTFEPPFLAWTYYADSASSLGHTLIGGWYRILSRVTRGRALDDLARTLVRPRVAYVIDLESDNRILACREADREQWALSVKTRPGASSR